MYTRRGERQADHPSERTYRMARRAQPLHLKRDPHNINLNQDITENERFQVQDRR